MASDWPVIRWSVCSIVGVLGAIECIVWQKADVFEWHQRAPLIRGGERNTCISIDGNVLLFDVIAALLLV